jgi:signal transduction histidine kinase
LNIKSRLDMIHGEVHYDASPNEGTVATVTVPIKP